MSSCLEEEWLSKCESRVTVTELSSEELQMLSSKNALADLFNFCTENAHGIERTTVHSGS